MVCNVVTYRARSAVREVGYALGFPRPLVDRVAKALETYDSVMVRRDLEAEGGFAEFFLPPGAGSGGGDGCDRRPGAAARASTLPLRSPASVAWSTGWASSPTRATCLADRARVVGRLVRWAGERPVGQAGAAGRAGGPSSRGPVASAGDPWTRAATRRARRAVAHRRHPAAHRRGPIGRRPIRSPARPSDWRR